MLLVGEKPIYVTMHASLTRKPQEETPRNFILSAHDMAEGN